MPNNDKQFNIDDKSAKALVNLFQELIDLVSGLGKAEEEVETKRIARVKKRQDEEERLAKERLAILDDLIKFELKNERKTYAYKEKMLEDLHKRQEASFESLGKSYDT